MCTLSLTYCKDMWREDAKRLAIVPPYGVLTVEVADFSVGVHSK